MADLVKRRVCRGCGSENIVRFVDLGEMPLAGGHLRSDQVAAEQRFPLSAWFCRDCSLVQILDAIPPDLLFQNYQYISSIIRGLHDHFLEYTDYLQREGYLLPGGFLVEFGCNDGVLLGQLQKRHVRSLGLDPSRNVSEMARARGLSVLTDYFTHESAGRVRGIYGTADVVTGSNVFAHVDDVHTIVAGARELLKPDGVFIVEVHYIVDLLDLGQYDTIYHEHLCYYSVHALQRIVAQHGMRLVDVVRLPMHGGAIRVVATSVDSGRQPKASVRETLTAELQRGVTSEETYSQFGANARRHATALRDMLVAFKAAGKTISGYGAPGRGTILLNYAGIGRDHLDYIVDQSELRANKLMPGVHIPIHLPLHLRQCPTDYSLLLAWNYEAYIVAQEQGYLSGGGRFIAPFPSPHLVP